MGNGCTAAEPASTLERGRHAIEIDTLYPFDRRKRLPGRGGASQVVCSCMELGCR